MPSCERCWSDSLSHDGDQEAEYKQLLVSRRCTIEQQAGPEAAICPNCARAIVHQHAHVCLLCGWRPDVDASHSYCLSRGI
jgi:predicted amidophosphoribosyltransferase